MICDDLISSGFVVVQEELLSSKNIYSPAVIFRVITWDFDVMKDNVIHRADLSVLTGRLSSA